MKFMTQNKLLPAFQTFSAVDKKFRTSPIVEYSYIGGAACLLDKIS